MNYYVYALVDPSRNDEPFYVGKGKNDRAWQHLNGNADKENRFKSARIKGIRNKGLEPKLIFLAEDLEEEPAYLLETQYITKYGRIGFEENGILTNRLLEGRLPNHTETGYKHSEETKALIRERAKSRPPQSEETRRKKSESMKRRSIPDEQRKRHSEIMKGRVMSPEEREKRRVAALGKKRGPYNWKLTPEERSENARKAGSTPKRPRS